MIEHEYSQLPMGAGGQDPTYMVSSDSTAFTHREPGTPVVIDGQPVPYRTLARLLIDFTLTGLPALVVPAGTDQHGLPIGLQIVGPGWSETRLLRIARQLEQVGILPGFPAPARLLMCRTA